MSADGFRFKKQIRIIRDMAMLPAIFDEPIRFPEDIPRSFSYAGNVLGIPARILYDDFFRYWIIVKEENQLHPVYNEAINRLLANEHCRAKSLGEIF